MDEKVYNDLLKDMKVRAISALKCLTGFLSPEDLDSFITSVLKTFYKSDDNIDELKDLI